MPHRIVPRSAKAAAVLKRRTSTNLYNERTAWLDNAHRDLDRAVAAAYGWPVPPGLETFRRGVAVEFHPPHSSTCLAQLRLGERRLPGRRILSEAPIAADARSILRTMGTGLARRYSGAGEVT